MTSIEFKQRIEGAYRDGLRPGKRDGQDRWHPAGLEPTPRRVLS
jgi:hypothetical protein